MASEALHPLRLTIHHLLNSPRVSIESLDREFLESAHDAVKLTTELLWFTKHVECKRLKDLEADTKDAARALEDVLDSQVSDQFLGGDDEEQPLLFSLDLQGVRQDIVDFVQQLKNIHRVFNPWFHEEEEVEQEEGEGKDGGGKESDIFGLSDQSWDTRTWLMSWLATKASSMFLGMKEGYFEELRYLFRDVQEDDDYTVLFTSDIIGEELESRFAGLKFELTKWWIDKAASFFVKEEECTSEIGNHLPKEKEKEKEDFVPSNMVESTDLSRAYRDSFLEDLHEFQAVSFVGMAGIGKTDLVMKIIHDPLFSSKFEYRIFVRMGPKCEYKDVLQAILAQLNLDGDHMLVEGDEDMEKYLYNTLLAKKFLIVLDDVWSSSILGDLRTIIPTHIAGSLIFLTTRIDEIADAVPTVCRVQFLDKDESWDLLRGKIFGEERCPYQLEKAGRKIAENCEGLPLLILTVADLLSKAERTPEYWSKIAADKTNSIFVGAYEKILEVLYPSYDYLPPHLKTCFLYMAAIPQNCEIRISKLINLWSAEGFLGDPFNSIPYFVRDNFQKIVHHNVALEPQRSSTSNYLKACSLHSVFWYLSKRVAWDEKFLHVLNSYLDVRRQDIGSPRRLSIYKNAILSRKDVRESIASMPVVRALLCTGPYHQYQVPMCLGLRLLKIFDALSIRFYEFPMEVLKLLHLRYLALTCNGNLLPSISKLWKLQCLIVHQHLSIRPSVSELSYVPVEIWDLQELEYVQIVGRNLPDPPPGAVLTKLLILLDVGARTITKRVVESIPNLEKLRVQIELVPGAVVPLSCFYDDISHFKVLKSLQCVVANPILVSEAVAPAPLLSMRYLRKLTLSGFGYPWKDMEKIAGLELRELKLQSYAFRGEKWELKKGEFKGLGFLSIEDTDPVQWTSSDNAFPSGLYNVSFKDCYCLQEIPHVSILRDIWLVDCHPSAATCAKKMELCVVHVDNSYMAR